MDGYVQSREGGMPEKSEAWRAQVQGPWDRRRLHTGQRLWGSLGLIPGYPEPTKGAEQQVGRPCWW